MTDEKKNGRISLQSAIAILAVVASLGGSWFAWGQKTGQLEQRVQTIEQRQAEDRRDTKESVHEVRRDVKQIGSDVQVILQTIKAMEAVQKSDRRERGQR